MYKNILCTFILMVVSCSFFVLSVSGAQEEAFHSTYQQVMEKLENLKPGKTIEVRMGTEKEQYDLGDRFEVRFQASKDCYFVLMYIVSDGEIVFLAPSSKIPDNRIKGGRVYSTGSDSRLTSEEEALYDFGMNFKVAPPEGIEIINLFCSPKRVELFKVDFETEPFYTIKPDDKERLKALLACLEQLEQSEWSGSSLKIKIGPEPALAPAPAPIPDGMTRGGQREPRKFGALPPIASTGTTGKWFPPVGPTGTTGNTEETNSPDKM